MSCGRNNRNAKKCKTLGGSEGTTEVEVGQIVDGLPDRRRIW
jgi:hypothetical protein